MGGLSSSPLGVAIRCRNLEDFSKALRAGANANETDRDGRNGLHLACIENLPEFVDEILSAGVDINAQDRFGWTALHFVAQDLHPEIACKLINANAGMEVRNGYGNTPLWVATMHSRGRGEMIELLLSHGADPEAANNHGVSPRTLAERIGNYDIKQFFEDPLGHEEQPNDGRVKSP